MSPPMRFTAATYMFENVHSTIGRVEVQVVNEELDVLIVVVLPPHLADVFDSGDVGIIESRDTTVLGYGKQCVLFAEFCKQFWNSFVVVLGKFFHVNYSFQIRCFKHSLEPTNEPS